MTDPGSPEAAKASERKDEPLKLDIFYSWQSDLDPDLNRNFIERALKDACKQLKKGGEVLPFLDRDVKGTRGTPDIIAVILGKIEKCQAFVADVSIVNAKHPDLDPASNGNVMFELGYAIKSRTWDRVLLVFNEAFGAKDKLPFDLGGTRRQPISYRLANAENADETRKALVPVLVTALEEIAKGERTLAREERKRSASELLAELKLRESHLKPLREIEGRLRKRLDAIRRKLVSDVKTALKAARRFLEKHKYPDRDQFGNAIGTYVAVPRACVDLVADAMSPWLEPSRVRGSGYDLRSAVEKHEHFQWVRRRVGAHINEIEGNWQSEANKQANVAGQELYAAIVGSKELHPNYDKLHAEWMHRFWQVQNAAQQLVKRDLEHLLGDRV